MIHVHSGLKLPGTDPHKRDTVPVRLVHISLDLEYKGREILLLHGIHRTLVRYPRKGRRRHRKEMLQKGLHAEVCKSRAKEHRRQLSLTYLLLIKHSSCTVLQLDLLH